ncbi:MAG: phosphate acetyltransferase, partial [Actinomycetota bacterium]|nr:phosphate acetyltransferase [Actinomycetota bacterium]
MPRLGAVPTRIYITSAEGHTGKSTIALGVLETLARGTSRVGVFRPISRSTTEADYVLQLLLDHATVDLAIEDCIGASYERVHTDPDGALTDIVSRFAAVERQCDAVVILGSDFTDVGSPTELSFNARIAANLGAPVLLVLGGRTNEGEGNRSADDMRQITDLTTTELRAEHAG